jgi:hypothetical protein
MRLNGHDAQQENEGEQVVDGGTTADARVPPSVLALCKGDRNTLDKPYSYSG